MAEILEPRVRSSSTAAGPSGGMNHRDLIYGLLGGAMVVLAVVLLVAGGERDTGSMRLQAPVLTMVHPAAGAVVNGPVQIVFQLAEELERIPGGWGVGDLHIHLAVGERDFMPAAQDIERLSSGMYRWTLSGLPPGEHTLRLFWAGPDHRPMLEGSSMPATVIAR